MSIVLTTQNDISSILSDIVPGVDTVSQYSSYDATRLEYSFTVTSVGSIANPWNQTNFTTALLKLTDASMNVFGTEGKDVTAAFYFSSATTDPLDTKEALITKDAHPTLTAGFTVHMSNESATDKNRKFTIRQTSEFKQAGAMTVKWSIFGVDSDGAYISNPDNSANRYDMSFDIIVKAKHMRFQFDLMADLATMLTIDPSYGTYDDLAYADADALCQLDVTAADFNGVFLFRSKDSLLNTEEPDMEFACNSTKWSNDGSAQVAVTMSGATVNTTDLVGGNTVQNISENVLKYDIIRHLAKGITGGYASSDVFTNEQELIDEVVAKDQSIHTVITGLLSDAANVGGFVATNGNEVTDVNSVLYYTKSGGVDNDYETQFYTDAAMTNMLTVRPTLAGDIAEAGGNLGQGIYDITTDNISRVVLQKLLTANEYTQARVAATYASRPAANLAQWMSVPFIAGDSFVMKVNYQPKSYTPLGTNTITDRSYKIVLNLV